MSIITRTLATMAVLFTQSLLPAAAQEQSPTLQASARSHVIVLAHRGCWGHAPENSVSAVEHCSVIGADEVEVDVRESRDGVLFVMHDETVDRTTDGTGQISALTAAEIRALHLKTGAGGSGDTLTSEHVPTVEEILAAAKGKVLVNLHRKVSADAKIAELVRRMGMTDQVTTWVTALPSDPELLGSPLRGAVGLIPTINECGPQYPQPCFTQPIESFDAYVEVHPVAFFLDWRQSRAFDQAVSQAKRPAGSRIFVETLNTVDALPKESRHAEWRSLVDMGVSVIMTNEPADLIDFLKTVEFQARPADADPLLKPVSK